MLWDGHFTDFGTGVWPHVSFRNFQADMTPDPFLTSWEPSWFCSRHCWGAAVCPPPALVLFTSHCWWPQHDDLQGRVSRWLGDGRKWAQERSHWPRQCKAMGFPGGSPLTLQQAWGFKPKQPAAHRPLFHPWRCGRKGSEVSLRPIAACCALCQAWGKGAPPSPGEAHEVLFLFSPGSHSRWSSWPTRSIWCIWGKSPGNKEKKWRPNTM